MTLLAMRNRFAPHIDFGFLQGVFHFHPTAQPSDIDGLIERKGRFFVQEWKHEQEQFSQGQERALRALSGEPNFTVILVHGCQKLDGTSIGGFYRVWPDCLCQLGHGMLAYKQYLKEWGYYADWNKE